MDLSSAKRICAAGSSCIQRPVTCCEGCSQRFCFKHFTEHHQSLNDEMNEVIKEHDAIKNKAEEQKRNGAAYQLIKKIYEWEKESITKIKKRANELRLELTQFAEIHTHDFSQKVQQLAEQINECREHGGLIETDLHRWRRSIEDLKLNFISPRSVTVEQHDDSALIHNISINVVKKTSNELFEQIFDGKARIEDNGQLVIHNNSNDCTEIRGKNEYSVGCHSIRLRLEETSVGWLFLGINSKLIPIESQSCYAKSSFGWSSNKYNWSSGEPEADTSQNRIQMQNNDIINLIFDCDNCMIMMVNERTKANMNYRLLLTTVLFLGNFMSF